MAIWYALIKYAGFQFAIVDWGIGGLVGLGSYLGASGEQSDLNGVFSALIAACAILCGQFFASYTQAGDWATEWSEEGVAAAESDKKLTAFLNAEYEGGIEITSEDLVEFREDELPELRKLAEGEITQDEYITEVYGEVQGFSAFVGMFRISTIVFLFFGVGTAYRIPINGFG